MTRVAGKLGVVATVLLLTAVPQAISVHASGSTGSNTQVQLTTTNVAYDSAGAANILAVAQITGVDNGYPTGTVAFFDRYNAFGSNVYQYNALGSPIALSLAGTATYKIKYPSAGTHQIYATYSGDSNYQGSSSQSTPQVLTVSIESTSTSVSAVPQFPAPGDQVKLYVLVKPAWAGSPTGLVAIYDSNGAQLSSATLSSTQQATLLVTAPTQPGTSVNYYASYGGDNNFQASTFGVKVTSTGSVVVTGTGSGGGGGVFQTTGSAPTTSTTVSAPVSNPEPISVVPHVNVSPADTATAATSAIAPAKGSVLPSDVLDTSVVAPTQPPQLLGSALTFGTALELGKYLVPVNIVVALWLAYAAHRGRRLTAIALQPR